MAADHYSVLGVPRDATTQDIKRAFRRIARECHPDVAGDDPTKVARFQDARIAYEILMDPVTRARYDRRSTRSRAPAGGGSFFDAFYKRTEDMQRERAQTNARRGERSGKRVRGGATSNNLGLDDLLDGFGGGRPKPPPTTNPNAGRGPEPVEGRDLEIELEVPERVAEVGGAVTATYFRMRRSDRWQPGDTDPGLVRVEDICEVRVLPGTRNAQVLRQHGMGDAGAWGGRAGDLLVRLKLVGGSEEVLPDEAPTSAIRSEATGDRRIDISLVQAVLGGKVLIETPQGPIRLTIPAGTNSHTKMRLRGKGPIGPAGPTDLVIEFRIVVPKTLDPQSRELMEAFGKMES